MNKNNKKSISVAKVITWMITFLLLYLPLVCLVLALALGCIAGIVYSILAMVDGKSLLGIIGLLLSGIIGYFLVFPFCVGILRPFFILYNNSGRDERIEITEAEAPELVHLIHEIADLTKNELPKHIYVSAAANASVFFDSKFSNIFVHVKKNIEVGLGIFKHMSLAESVSCIAHEYGHFSQDTMRWGTAVHILNAFIVNVMNINERWNTLVNKIINCPWIIGQGIVLSLACKAAGWTLYGITIGYMRIMEAIYKKIQLAHLELSRKMEYEADAIAARIVGSDTYISFASKLMEISKREDAFLSMTQRMASGNFLVKDYWEAYSKTDQYIAELTNSKINSSKQLTEPLDLVEDPKLIFEAIYSSHPDWNSRIATIRIANYSKTTDFKGRAWDLIPISVKERVAKQSMEDLASICDSKKPVHYVTEEELAEIIDKSNYWHQLATYFARDIVKFNYNECTPNPVFELCDNTSISIINKYNSAKRDYDNAQAIIDNHDINKAIYQGVVYKTSKLPIDDIREEYEKQKKCALAVDKGICEYAMSRVSDINDIKEAYRRLFYAQEYLDYFATFVSDQQSATIKILNKSVSKNNSHQYTTIQDSLSELNAYLVSYGLRKMDMELFEQYAPQNAVECVKVYKRTNHLLFSGDSISGEDINLLISTCNWIRDVHENILSRAKMAIIDACLGRTKNIPAEEC